MIVILLKKHLEDLRRQSYENPLLEVPTGENLAEASGVTGSTISKIMQNNVKRLNLSVIDSIIEELRRRGFNTNVSDIIEYIGPPVNTFNFETDKVNKES